MILALRGARAALQSYWGTAILVILAGSLALASSGPVLDLASRLRYASVSASTLGLHWSVNATTPAQAQGTALGLLSQLLLIAALGTLALAAIGILSISAARATARAPEIAVRRAVGASRRNLVSAALGEGGAIGVVTLLVGAAVGLAGLLLAISFWSGTVATGDHRGGLIASAAILLVIVVGALFQLIAATPRRIDETPPRPLQLYVPAFQLSAGLVVLMASTMLVRHASSMMHQASRAGDNGLVYQLSLDDSAPARSAELAAIIARTKGTPGVESASMMSPGTLVGMGMVDMITTNCGQCSDGGIFVPLQAVKATHQFVSADSFRALGIQQLEGRLLTDEDDWDAERVAVISENLARKHFQDGRAIGRQILLQLDRPQWYTVVGVVAARDRSGFGSEMQPSATIYLSILQHPPSTADLLVRSRLASAPSLPDLGTPAREADLRARETRPLAWFGRWFAIQGWAMLAVTLAGAFVLMRLWVRSLFHELGIRRSLGAQRRRVLGYILVRAGATGLAGVAIAAWFGPALWDTMPELVSGLPPWGLGDLGLLALLLVTIALAGALLPAIQAVRSTPSGLIGSFGE